MDELSFAAVFTRLLAESGKSLTEVAKLSGLDRSYCLRLMRGDRVNPEPAAVMKLFIGLVFDSELYHRKPTALGWVFELLEAAGLTALAKRSLEVDG